MKRLSFALVIVVLTGGPLRAEWPGACAPDVPKLCAGKKAVSLCLIDHESELTPGCAAMVAGWSRKSAQNPKSWLGACSPDAEKLCAGKRAISLCLVDREKELSPTCAALVQGWSKKNDKTASPSWLAACSADAEKVCPGKHALNLCMMEHKKELSDGCRGFIDGAAKKTP